MPTPKRVSAYSQAVREAQTQPEDTAPPPAQPILQPVPPPIPTKKAKPELERISLYVYPHQRKKINQLLRQYEYDTERRIDQQDILRWLINRADMNTVYEGEAMDEGNDQ